MNSLLDMAFSRGQKQAEQVSDLKAQIWRLQLAFELATVRLDALDELKGVDGWAEYFGLCPDDMKPLWEQQG